jgi:hypothetical protein
MDILYYDCFAGISGDMHLAAMLDCGVDADHLLGELDKLGLDGYRIDIRKDMRKGISGTKVDIIVEESHHHRGLSDIEKIINTSGISENVKSLSLKIFRNLAAAEAKVHDTDIEKIHFHEVGTVDAILDIVGAAVCIDYLKPDAIYSSPVELGGGFAECMHGKLPVPAPATVELLTGIPTTSGRVDYEATTPTGAAILSTCVDEFVTTTSFTVKKTGYGIGTKDENIPNILRIHLAKSVNHEDQSHTTASIVECNIDDMNPEYYDHIFEMLFAAGAADVYITPIIMKKSRPAVTLSVLCGDQIEKTIEDILLNETSSIGLRKYPVQKTMLERQSKTVSTPYGDVRVKSAVCKNGKIKSKAEYDDCKKIAQKHNLPLSEVYAIVEKQITEQL